MRTAQTRNPSRRPVAALATLLTLASACSFDELKPAITVVVHNIPSTVDHLTVVLNDSGSGTLTRTPAFGIGSLTDLEVVFPAPSATGVITIVVTALDHDQSPLASSTLTGNYQTAGLVLETTLTAQSGFVGQFGAPCGSNAFCGTGLTCTKYTSSDTVGLCTRNCGGSFAACETTPAGASCTPFKAAAGQNICQWECDNADGGANLACPAGLTCGAQISIGGVAKRFCQGAP